MSEINELPDDPELAFLELAKQFESELDEATNNAHSNLPYRSYVERMLAADEALETNLLGDWELSDDPDSFYQDYLRFSQRVLRVTTATSIRKSRNSKRYSVPLDEVTREKIRHYLAQLTEVAQKLEVSESKRDAIISKIIALSEEIERSRTRFEVVGEFVVSAATYAGLAGDKLESWRKMIDAIAGLLGKAKEVEVEIPELPAPKKPKQIEPPKVSTRSEELRDDDIPF